MSMIQRLSTVVSPAAPRAGAMQDYIQRFWAGEEIGPWLTNLSAAGIHVSPDLAMTLTALAGGTRLIAEDIATLPCHLFQRKDFKGMDGKERVAPRSSIGTTGMPYLAYKLRWQPNVVQTASEFWFAMTAQLILRERAYAEIVGGNRGAFDQLLPRHPDRVTEKRLPSGAPYYLLTERDGKTRPLTSREMFVIRGLSFDGGLTPASRISYGANSLGSALAVQSAAGRFFKSGMTASSLATYDSQADIGEEEEEALHKSITRFAQGLENAFGLMLVPDNIKVSNLGVNPEKAQMMDAQEWGVREVARMLNLPGSKLGIRDSVSYNSQLQAAVDYVVSTIRPLLVIIEQSIQRDLIVEQDEFFAEFLAEALLRGDPSAQAEYYSKAIEKRWMWPSEVRVRQNMNPDERLDRLAEADRQPGKPAGAESQPPPAQQSRRQLRAMLVLHDAAARCVRRERAKVEKLAQRHADDPDGWQAALRDFFAEHASFVAEAMRIPHRTALEYSAQHGSELAARGIVVHTDDWERYETDELCVLAMGEAA